jgi:hypothetical protein
MGMGCQISKQNLSRKGNDPIRGMANSEQRGKRFQAIYQFLLPAGGGGGIVYTIGLIRDGDYQGAAIAIFLAS